MSKTSSPQCASIELPLGCEPPVIHCPVCGNATVAIGDEGAKVTPCHHPGFIYVGELGDFEYQSDDFEKRTEHVEMNDFTIGTFRQILTNVGYGNGMFAIEMTYGEIACGPVWCTDVYGFDFASFVETRQMKWE